MCELAHLSIPPQVNHAASNNMCEAVLMKFIFIEKSLYIEGWVVCMHVCSLLTHHTHTHTHTRTHTHTYTHTYTHTHAHTHTHTHTHIRTHIHTYTHTNTHTHHTHTTIWNVIHTSGTVLLRFGNVFNCQDVEYYNRSGGGGGGLALNLSIQMYVQRI